MSSASILGKDVLETIVSWAEIFTIAFTFVGAFSGVIYLTFNRPLKKIEAAERREADQRFQELKARNLELEKSLAPRTLVLTFNNGKPDLPTLVPYAGINVILEALPDAEAFRAAGTVKGVAEAAGWKVVQQSANPSLNQASFDGVVISAHLPATKMIGPTAEYEDAQKCWDAAEALASYLESNNWVARRVLIPHTEALQANTVKISVGFKPSPYFDPFKKERK